MCRSGYDSYVTPCDRKTHASLNQGFKNLIFLDLKRPVYVTPCDQKAHIRLGQTINSLKFIGLMKFVYVRSCNWSI